VAALADQLKLPSLAARSVRSLEVIGQIRAVAPDLLVVAAFGGFLPPALLGLGRFPPVNIHPSLLPRHRGPAPVNWSLIRGDREVGVSLIFLEEEMDAGPILSQRSFPVKGESAGVWEERLTLAGAEDLLAVIAGLKAGTVCPRPQAAPATVNPLLRKEDGRVDFQRPAAELAGLINGVDPWPGAQARFKGRSLKLFGAAPADLPRPAQPGEVLGLEGGRLLVAAGQGALALAELQPEGKKRLPAAEFQRGYRPERLESCGN
jgi:methionyl-tRNA formyltransferase